MRNSHGEGRAQVVPRQETVDVVSTTPRKCLSSLQIFKAYQSDSCGPMLQLPHDGDAPVEERRRGQDCLQCVCVFFLFYYFIE